MLKSPTLLVDRSKCMQNIRRMANKASDHQLLFKPHFKTHQSAIIGEWFREFGISAITVSSVSMARYFANNGWNDITIAFPVNPREIDRIDALAENIELSLFLFEKETAELLDRELSNQVSTYIEIDTGAGRTGFRPEQREQIEQLADSLLLSQHLKFKGFYSHPGHSYAARSQKQVLAVHQEVLDIMRALKSDFENGTGDLACCIGDTPCCSIAEDFEGIDEISPGNFVYYDLMQAQIGSCLPGDIAVALAAPVVARHPDRKDLIIHGGAVHLSKEFISISGDERIFGRPVAISDGDLHWGPAVEGSHLKYISQEHGVLKCSDALFQTVRPGDLIGILPVHSCLTANLMRGNQQVLDS